MRAVVVETPNHVRLRTLPVPQVGPGEVLIRTAYAGICATDFEIIEGRIAHIRYPHIPGHEWSGTVEAVGDPSDASMIGARVVASNFITCGRCPACHQGRWNDCVQAKEIGFDLPGGYGECFVTRTDLLRPISAAIAAREACLIEPTAVCVYAVERAHIHMGDSVVIIGDGPIGLISVQLAHLQGAGHIIVIGGRDSRLALARSLGADETINYHHEPDIVAAVKRHQQLTDVALEVSGSPTAFENAFEMLGTGGRLAVVGDYSNQTVRIDPTSIVHRNLTMIGSKASPGTWDTALALVAAGHVQLHPLITDVYPLEEWETAIATARSHRDGVIKVVIEYEGR